MQTTIETRSGANKTVWAGRILSALPVLFLLMDAIGKILKPAPVIEATVKLGYEEGMIVTLGIITLVCLVLYVIPQTAVLGAILLTGYLGGAEATQVRVNADPFALVFPILLGLLIWGGLYLRDERLRALIPVRR
jgi:hypothetical protein